MIVAFAGGVGGAKLAQGLYQALPPDTLTVVGNTADDFEHFGLHISPDLDTVLYTLAGLANPVTGWGLAGDTFRTLELLERYGAATWFRIGDLDFATHLRRTELLRAGRSLSEVTALLMAGLGVRARLLPMCDEPVSTVVTTPAGELAFQDYFVRRQHQDPVRAVRFAGIERATVPPAVVAALRAADLIVLCPSNPLVSLGPILAVPGLRELLRAAPGVKLAVSPIVGGRALKGPADRMLADLGHAVSPLGVATLYRDFLDAFVLDEQDAALAPQIAALGLATLVAQTVMGDTADRARFAAELLRFAHQCRAGQRA